MALLLIAVIAVVAYEFIFKETASATSLTSSSTDQAANLQPNIAPTIGGNSMVPNYNDYSIGNLQLLADHIAGQYNIPANIFSAQINQESGFNPHAEGDYGLNASDPSAPTSFGLGQINVLAHPKFDVTRAMTGNNGLPDLSYQLNYQAEYLSNLYNQYGDWPAALARYNGSGPAATAYANKILSAAGGQ